MGRMFWRSSWDLSSYGMERRGFGFARLVPFYRRPQADGSGRQRKGVFPLPPLPSSPPHKKRFQDPALPRSITEEQGKENWEATLRPDDKKAAGNALLAKPEKARRPRLTNQTSTHNPCFVPARARWCCQGPGITTKVRRAISRGSVHPRLYFAQLQIIASLDRGAAAEWSGRATTGGEPRPFNLALGTWREKVKIRHTNHSKVLPDPPVPDEMITCRIPESGFVDY